MEFLVESVRFKKVAEWGVRMNGVGSFPGEERAEQVVDRVGEIRVLAGGCGEVVEIGPLRGGERVRVVPEERRDRELIIGWGEEGLPAGQAVGEGAARVDGEVVDDRVHREGKGKLQARLGLVHDRLHPVLGLGLAVGGEDESHAAARHAAEHPESPEVVAECLAGPGDERLGDEIGGPGDDGLQGAVKVPGGGPAEGLDVAALEGVDELVEEGESLPAGGPFRGRAQKVLLGDHLKNGADVLGHASVDEDEGILESLAGGSGNFVFAIHMVARHETPARNAVFRINRGGGLAGDELDAGPDAARVLPAAAGASNPLAEDGPGQDEAPFLLLQRADQRVGLAGGTHEDPNEGREEIGGNGEPGPLGNVVD